MNGFALLLATAILGVDYGWQPASDGRLEYIIQIEPITLFALRDGQEVVSQIDPFVRDVRRFRIRVGTEVVPRLGTPVPESAAAFSAATSAPPPGVTYGWQPANAQQVEFLVQIAPERLAALQNDPIVGEIPFELKNVARVRIRSGTGNLPRQNIPQTIPATTAAALSNGPTPQGTRPADGTVAAAGLPGSAPRANSTTNNGGSAKAANPGSGWPSNNRNPTTGQPSRYDPPGNTPTVGPAVASPAAAANAPSTDPRSNYSPNASTPSLNAASSAGPVAGQSAAGAWPTQPGQNSGWQAQETYSQNAANQTPSWPAPQQPVAGGQVPSMTPVNQPPSNVASQVAQPAQPGLTDPGNYRAWDSGSAVAAGNYTGAQPPAATSPPWGVPDDRYTTERGQSTGNSSPAATAGSGWGPLVSLPQPPPQPPASPPLQASSWGTNSAGAQPTGEMVSPFADALTVADRSSGSLEAYAQPPWGSTGGDLKEAGFVGNAKQKKVPDFWADLAQAADDPSLGFLREESSSTSSDKPWWPLTLAMLALFASMGGNLYMGWIAVDVYRRYLDMAGDAYEDDSHEPPRDRDDGHEWADRPRRRERAAVED